MKRKPVNIISELLSALHSVRNRFDEDLEKKKFSLLQKLSAIDINQPAKLIEYHSLLLFLLAYPQSKLLYDLAESELERVAGAAKAIFEEKNQRKKLHLANTGIAFTRLNISLSFDLVNWLLKEFTDDVELFSIDADEQTVEQVLCACLSPFERDLIADKMFSPMQMIHRLKQKEEDDLAFLVRLFIQSKQAPLAKDTLWDSLKIFVSWNLSHASLTFERSINSKIFFHKNSLVKNVKVESEVRKPLTHQHYLDQEQQQQLLKTARTVLAMFLRETDPVTYADAEQVEIFSMDRGVDIALFPMITSRRLPLESYIGYVAFKNRIPVAYGGGWIFLHRSKIGINIFPHVRGGESAFIFTQILRLYHQQFNVRKFIVEPYQFGKRNSEGLKSGAYWFYHRLGFRSTNAEVKIIAEEESKKISLIKDYTTPPEVLREFTKANLELNLSPRENYPDANPLNVALALHKNPKLKSEIHDWTLLKNKMDEKDFIIAVQEKSSLHSRIIELAGLK